MKKKLKSGKGTTLVEMLVALVLLSLLTAGGVAATSAVMTDYNKMSEAARADLLASTVIEAINNEVRLGRDFTVEASAPSELRLDSAFFGADSCIKLEDGKLVAEITGSTPVKQLLSDKTYGGLKLAELNFTAVSAAAGGSTGERPVFNVSFEVKSAYGDAALWSGSVDVASLSR